MLKTKMVISFLLAPRRSSLARTNALQLRAREKDIWSGKAQRSLRRKRFVARSDTRRNLVGTLVVCDNSSGPAMAAGGRADAHDQRRHTSGGTSTQVQFCLSARMLVRGYGGFLRGSSVSPW